MSARVSFAAITLAVCTSVAIGCSASWRVTPNVVSVESSQVLTTGPSDRHLNKGINYYGKGDLARATKHFEKAILADDGSGTAHNNLGLVYYEMGEFYKAAWSFQCAMQRTPDNPEPIYNLGLTFEEGEKYEEALGLYQQAHSMATDNPQYLGNVIRTRRKLGEPVEMLVPELQELLLIENRPEWREWIRDLLHYETLASSHSSSDNASVYEEIDDRHDSDISVNPVEDLPPPTLPLDAPLP